MEKRENDAIVTIKHRIEPTKLLFKNRIHTLTYVDPKFIHHEFYLYLTFDNRLLKVKIKSFHPNCDPTTKLLCLPTNLINKPFSKKSINHVISLLRTFNFDDCYYQPWKDIRYS